MQQCRETRRSVCAMSWAFSSVAAKVFDGRRPDRRCTSARGGIFCSCKAGTHPTRRIARAWPGRGAWRAAAPATVRGVSGWLLCSGMETPFVVPVILRCEPQRASKDARPGRLGRILRGPILRPPQDDGEQASLLIPATHLRPRFADQSHEAFASKKIRGGGAPKRRNRLVRPRHAIRCCHLLALRTRPRVQRDALAFRRSTAALARLLPLTLLRPAFPGTTGCKREDPPRRQCSELLADRPTAPTAPPRSRPGAECLSSRLRYCSRSAIRSTPHDGVPYSSEMPPVYQNSNACESDCDLGADIAGLNHVPIRGAARRGVIL